MSEQHAPLRDDEESLRSAGERVERLLAELRASIAPLAWQRVEELVATMTTLYGRGLSRVLTTFADAGALDEAARARLCEDPLVASLLLLHGLHPLTAEERIEQAIDRVRRAIGRGAFTIELVHLDEHGEAVVRLGGTFRDLRLGRAAVVTALEHAIAEVAPEVERVAIEGGDFAPQSDATLVQIDLSRSRRPVAEASG